MEKENNIVNEKLAALEALLFYYGEPMAIKEIADIMEENEETIKNLILELKQKLFSDSACGLEIIEYNNKVELVTKPQHSHLIRKILNNELKENITPAGLETLAIIAYLGPITRAQIDYIRGVNSAFILRNLLVRGLIVRTLEEGKKNTYVYTISHDFLKHLGLSDITKLPEYEKYRNILVKLEEFKKEEQEDDKMPNQEKLDNNLTEEDLL